MAHRTDPEGLFQLAHAAEALGFHSVWVGDSLTARPRIDALTTLAAVGALCQRIRLGTAIFLAALRNPILLAYQLASLDWITTGRIDLGVGYGRLKESTQEHEFHILGLDPTMRIKITEETIDVMRRLWREHDVSYTGRFSRFERVTLEPKPVQTNGIPIWIASNNVEPGLRRVARMGNGWLNNITNPNVYRECWEKIAAYAREAGRDAASIEPGLYFTVAIGNQDIAVQGQAFLARYYNRPYDAIGNAMLCVIGSPNQVMDQLETYVEAGARTIILRFAADGQLRQLELCAEWLQRRRLMS
jgi:alkanesulfonate monooxygenase SsuD/methylene tetrahydromethanopterin reductase-like flavin-dependent oxidoreductase (luciferase family)